MSSASMTKKRSFITLIPDHQVRDLRQNLSFAFSENRIDRFNRWKQFFIISKHDKLSEMLVADNNYCFTKNYFFMNIVNDGCHLYAKLHIQKTKNYNSK